MSTLDQLRGMYSKSPAWVKNLAGRVIGLVPKDLQYGPAFKRTLELIAQTQGNAPLVRQYQHERLGEILKVAKHSPYYAQLFRDLGLHDAQPGDLARLPILNKDTVRLHGPEAFLGVPKSGVDGVSSSGSSGTPFHFYLNKDRSVREFAYINHVWGNVGYRAGHVRAVLRDMRVKQGGDLWTYDPALKELRMSALNLSPENLGRYLAALEEYNVNFVHGYPSAMFTLALHAKRTGWVAPKSLMGLLPISEVMYPEQRAVVSEAFGGVPIQAFYGLSEKVAFAGEVPGQIGVYDFEPTYGIVEIVDDAGQAVPPGQEGRLIATGLLCSAMPFLRYDTGDRATLLQAPSLENGYRLRAKNIRSKWSPEYLVGKSGALLPLTALTTPRDEYARIKEMQYHQDTPGVATLRVVPVDAATSAEDFASLVAAIQTGTSGDLQLRVQIVEEIAANTRGKRKFIEQLIPIAGTTTNPETEAGTESTPT